MFNVTMTINGRPVTASNVKNELERAALEAVRESITDKLRQLPASASGERLQVNVVGSDLSHLEIKLSGPQELIDKAKELLDVN